MSSRFIISKKLAQGEKGGLEINDCVDDLQLFIKKEQQVNENS